MALRILTLNINGLLNAPSQYELLSLCVKEKISLVLLQETHFTNTNNVLKLKSMFDSDKCYFSFDSNRSRGVGIIVLNPDIKISKFHLDIDGRLVYIDIAYNNIQYRVVNIYAPNDESERILFFEDIYPLLLCNKHLILGGDFNCVLNTKLDKIGGNPNYGTIGSKSLRNIISDFQLIDCYRYLYPNVINTTWTSTNVACRLDRFYVKNIM